MNITLRELLIADHNQVIEVSKSVWEDDYATLNFPSWMEDPNWSTYGVFESEQLKGFLALQLIPDTTNGWVKALRVRNGSQGAGVGTQLTKHTVTRAQDLGVKRLWYATSSRNKASIRIAEKSGFKLVNSVGYFRLERPLPQHPNPSPHYEPEVVEVDRVQEILSIYPDLVPTDTIPIAWSFETKDSEGLQRINRMAVFRIVRDDDGIPKALYYTYVRERSENKAAINSIYVSNRSIFVDVVSRILTEHETTDIDTLVFFLGPNGTEWSKTLGIVPEEFNERRFLLFEQTF